MEFKLNSNTTKIIFLILHQGQVCTCIHDPILHNLIFLTNPKMLLQVWLLYIMMCSSIVSRKKTMQSQHLRLSTSWVLEVGKKKKKNCLLPLWLKMQVCTSPVSLELGMSRVLHSVDNTLAPDFEIEDQYTKEAGNMKNSPCCSGFCSKVKLGAHAWNIQCPKPLISTV